MGRLLAGESVTFGWFLFRVNEFQPNEAQLPALSVDRPLECGSCVLSVMAKRLGGHPKPAINGHLKTGN